MIGRNEAGTDTGRVVKSSSLGICLFIAVCLAGQAWADVAISLTAPANGSVYQAGINITLSATATANKGYTLRKVEFFQGTTLIGTDTTAPYSILWNSVPAGSYSLTAKATATKKNKPDQTASSAAVNIAINATAVLLYFIHVDHLNSPRLVTDQGGQTVWRWDQQEPFGNNATENPSGLGAFDFPLRFPGQHFDKETQLHYNSFRDYDPIIGRYSQSDPIGLRGGLNTYSYVGSDPLAWSDPLGLEVLVCQRPLGGIWGGFNRGASASYDSYIPSMINPLFHQYLCVGGGSEFKCGGQGTAGGIIAPGKPSEDDYPYNRPDLCKPIQATNCVEQCVLGKLASSQRPFYVLLYSDCQRWSRQVLKECQEECKGK